MRRNTSLLLVMFTIIVSLNLSFYLSHTFRPLTEQRLEKGDLILQNYYEHLIPGPYSHIQLYLGNGIIIESEPGIGVHLNKAKRGDVYRVKGKRDMKEKAIHYAVSKLGAPYNFNFTVKKVDGNCFYCSELVWNAFLSAGIDLDDHPGFSKIYGSGVFPSEIAEDSDTSFIMSA